MKHLGDITKISGYEVEPVDIICGGSPCQDLSVAGKRAGLAGERSGLFMEQIRIIKEMRERGKADDVIRPRYMVWENVPGAFSSNNGEDFRAVLEETAKIADENATIPRPENGKWAPAGCIVGDGWSIAWRVHDAQFWGVAQRRKRICLLADFNGQDAGRVLFELRRNTDDPSREQVIMDTGEESQSEVQSVGKGVSRDIAQSGKEGQGTAEDVERGVGEAIGFTNRGFESGKVTETLRSEPHGAYPMVAYDEGGVACGKEGKVTILNPSDSQGNQVADSDGIYPTLRGCGGAGYQQGYLFERKNSTTVFGISSYDSNAMKSSNPHSGIYEADTSRTLDLNGGSPACNQGGMAVVQAVGVDTYNQSIDEEVAQPLRAADGGDSTPKVCYRKTSHAKSKEDGQGWQETEVNDTLNIFDNGESRTPTVIVEVAQPLRCAEGGDSAPKVVAFTQNQRNEVRDLGEKAGALAAERGVHQQTYVLEGNGSRPSHKGDGYSESDTMYTLNTVEQHAVCIENHPADSRVKIAKDGKVQTLSSRMGTGGGNVPMVMETYQKTTGALMASGYDKLGTQEAANGMYVVHSTMAMQAIGEYKESECASALKQRDYKDSTDLVCSFYPQMKAESQCFRDDNISNTLVNGTNPEYQNGICYGLDRAAYNQGQNAQYNFAVDEEKIGTQVAKGPGAVCNTVVRRLTPLECTRLQGFPDGWVDIGEWVDSRGKLRKDSDANKYKALGNSIALPFWQWLAERMVAVLKADGVENPTMGSLFDGISGFCLVFVRACVKPVFSSEIEEFPIAVAKKHFGDDDLGLEGDYERYL